VHVKTLYYVWSIVNHWANKVLYTVASCYIMGMSFLHAGLAEVGASDDTYYVQKISTDEQNLFWIPLQWILETLKLGRLACSISG
jgi:hypothetical protein